MLFDNNYGFGMNIIDLPNNDAINKEILSPYESFLKGNSFKDEYIPYKRYTFFKLNPKNNEEKLLYEIMSLCFIINDLNLYLDLNSDDKKAFNLFQKYLEEEKKLEDKYIKEYGPLTLNDIQGKYSWLGDMPWQNKRSDFYV